MIEAEQVQDRGVQVVNRNLVFVTAMPSSSVRQTGSASDAGAG